VPAQPGAGLGFACVGCADLRNQLADALRLAYTDELTCLPNRRALYREMDERSQAAEVYGLAFLDVDGFKAINDVHGHATGDRVLFQLAARLRQLSDQRGWLAARLGGDEFAVLLPAMSIEDAAAAAHEIHECFSEPITLLSVRVFPSATVGVAVAAAGEPPRNVRHRADIAMYQAKGRDPGVGRSGPPVGLTPVRTRGKL
jgi:diguanylate cyclase (GGDEF)-like protein